MLLSCSSLYRQAILRQSSYTCPILPTRISIKSPPKVQVAKVAFLLFELNRFRSVLRKLFDEQWRKHLADFFQILLVNIVKGGQVLAVDVEDGCHFPTL